jgi:hypothetical protein
VSTDRQDPRLVVAVRGLRDGFAQLGRVDIEDWEHLLRVAGSVLAGFIAAGLLAEAESAPRSWSLPTIPEDVKRVRDKDGEEWVPVAESPGDWQIDSPDWSRYEYASVADLIADYGPLVEVLDGTDA